MILTVEIYFEDKGRMLLINNNNNNNKSYKSKVRQINKGN
jgi:hypothetical protein